MLRKIIFHIALYFFCSARDVNCKPCPSLFSSNWQLTLTILRPILECLQNCQWLCSWQFCKHKYLKFLKGLENGSECYSTAWHLESIYAQAASKVNRITRLLELLENKDGFYAFAAPVYEVWISFGFRFV